MTHCYYFMKRSLLITLSWLSIAVLTLLISLGSYLKLSSFPLTATRPVTEFNSAETTTSQAILPNVLGAFSYSVKSEDAIPEIIKSYLKKYRSPLLPHADFLITTSRKYNLDPRLIVAIAQQESNLCKKAPTDSNNCWGWGVHSRGTLKFDSYQDAIEAVTQGLSQNYINKGLDTPEEIMAIYTPLSEGSWATGVQQFLNDME